MDKVLRKSISIIFVVLLIITALPLASNSVNAAELIYETTWKEYNYGSSNGVENKDNVQ